ncbi:unnamed protein product [Calypogeia fissa]
MEEEDTEVADLQRKIPLPEVFLTFLKQNGVDPAVYDAARDLPRYIRLKRKLDVSEIEEELGVKLSPLSWLPGFYSIPREVQIAGTKAYQEGKIYGMDAASGAAVEALELCPGDHVLDLCAAPGAKLCMMADLLKDSGTLTGTDISPSRLAASRTMLLKYGLGSCCRLFLADGTTFSLLPLKGGAQDNAIPEVANADVKILPEQTEGHGRHRGSTYVDSKIYAEWKSTKSAKEKKAAKRLKYLEDSRDRVGGRESELLYYGKSSGIVGVKVADVFSNSCSDDALDGGYDKVLVDAECTHDGSLKHIYKYEQWGWDTFERRFFNSERMTTLTSLQLSLLSNGFRLLKVGGTLVYSTCSFTIAQNEDVVKNFLALHRNAELQKIDAASLWPYKTGGLPHTLRFDPFVSKTSGLFIAKISRLGT